MRAAARAWAAAAAARAAAAEGSAAAGLAVGARPAAAAAAAAPAARRALWTRAPLAPPPPPSLERALGRGFSARLAVVNALHAAQASTHWGRLLAALAAERAAAAAAGADAGTAWCFRAPVSPAEAARLAAAEAAEAAALRAARRGPLRAARAALAAAWRLLVLAALFAPAAAFAPYALGAGGSRLRRRARAAWLRLFRRTVERAGPALIKWGQWAATRHDLFAPDFCAELEKLHSNAPAHSAAVTEAAVRAAFGFSTADLFDDFDPAPVASGSIGQIHSARLSPAGARLTGCAPGARVAVKVRHPGVSASIERDFALMQAAAAALGALPGLRGARLGESLEQFAAPLREQVDLAGEARNLHAFNFNFRRDARVRFPVPLYPLVAPAVLVESFEEGAHISEYVARGAGSPHTAELAVLGTRAMLHMLLVDSLVHGDLHPGNILVRLEPPRLWGARAQAALRRADAALRGLSSKPPAAPGGELQEEGALGRLAGRLARPRLVMLDAGMATRLSAEDSRQMVGLFDAFSRLDGVGVAERTLRFAGERQACADPDAFVAAVDGLFRALQAADAFAPGDASNGAAALGELLELVRTHSVSLPGHICATVVTTLVLEGWSHRLDPRHSTLQEVQRILAARRGGLSGWVRAWLTSPVADSDVLGGPPWPLVLADLTG